MAKFHFKSSNGAVSGCQPIRVWLGIWGKTIHSCDARVESGKTQGFLHVCKCIKLHKEQQRNEVGLSSATDQSRRGRR